MMAGEKNHDDLIKKPKDYMKDQIIQKLKKPDSLYQQLYQ